MKVLLVADPATEALVEKMRGVEREVAGREGAFSLFALLEREDTPGVWDVVAAAPWLRADRESILKITRAITSHLTPEESVCIARVVPLPPDSDFVRLLQMVSQGPPDAEGPLISLGPSTLGGVDLRQGYILASDASAAQTREAIAA